MFTITKDNFEYLPIQYILAWSDKIKREIAISITKADIDMLVTYCNRPGKFIWDFRNISFANDREFKEAFELLKQRRRKIIFANVERDSALEKAMLSGIANGQVKKVSCDSEKNNHYYVGDAFVADFNSYLIEEIHKNYLKTLIDKKCIETKYQYLVSSGVYSNMQINLKNLFADVINFPYVIYLLWEQIDVKDVDGLIATSKNGVAFTSILGEVLGLPVLYFNIGQMFEETYNCSPVIRKGGKYIHIYDMICLGSEAKVLNALVNAQGGEVLKSVGCVCLLDLEIVKKKNRYSSMNHVWSLLGQKDLKREYVICLHGQEV